MERRTVRIDGRITSTTLEAEFWGHLAELAAERGIRLAPMFRIALAAVPAGTSRASRVRVFCLQEARATARARELALGSPPAVLAQAADPSPR